MACPSRACIFQTVAGVGEGWGSATQGNVWQVNFPVGGRQPGAGLPRVTKLALREMMLITMRLFLLSVGAAADGFYFLASCYTRMVRRPRERTVIASFFLYTQR